MTAFHPHDNSRKLALDQIRGLDVAEAQHSRHEDLESDYCSKNVGRWAVGHRVVGLAAELEWVYAVERDANPVYALDSGYCNSDFDH